MDYKEYFKQAAATLKYNDRWTANWIAEGAKMVKSAKAIALWESEWSYHIKTEGQKFKQSAGVRAQIYHWACAVGNLCSRLQVEGWPRDKLVAFCVSLGFTPKTAQEAEVNEHYFDPRQMLIGLQNIWHPDIIVKSS